MNNKAAALVTIAGAVLAGCADNSALSSAAPQAAVPIPAAAVSSLGTPPLGTGASWQVRRVTCAQLLAAPAPERQSATMFYYGWLAGRQKTETIERARMDADLRRVMDQCARTPEMTVADAFHERLTTPAHWIWQQP